MTGRLVVVCINLDWATERWEATRRGVAAVDLPGPLVRLAATDGRHLTEDALARCASLQTRWNVRHRHRVCDRRLLNTPEAIGCYLSHHRAWRWLSDHEEFDAALVLEDDCCLDPALGTKLRGGGDFAPLLAQPTEWDFVALGYIDLFPRGIRPGRQTVAVGRTGVTAHRPDVWHYGAHCYLVSRVGAAALCARAFPAELHVDFWLAILAIMGEVRGHLAPVSLATQCRRDLQPAIPHYAWDSVNWKIVTPDIPVIPMVVGLMLAAIVITGWLTSKANTTP